MLGRAITSIRYRLEGIRGSILTQRNGPCVRPASLLYALTAASRATFGTGERTETTMHKIQKSNLQQLRQRTFSRT